jgi:hypothetical protein
MSFIECPPHFNQQPFWMTRLDEKRVRTGNTRAAMVTVLGKIRQDHDDRIRNIVLPPNGADEGEPIELSAGEDEVRDDNFRTKGTQHAKCGVWPGYAVDYHAVVSEEGHMYDAVVDTSIDEKQPAGSIDMKWRSHI